MPELNNCMLVKDQYEWKGISGSNRITWHTRFREKIDLEVEGKSTKTDLTHLTQGMLQERGKANGGWIQWHLVKSCTAEYSTQKELHCGYISSDLVTSDTSSITLWQSSWENYVPVVRDLDWKINSWGHILYQTIFIIFLKRSYIKGLVGKVT